MPETTGIAPNSQFSPSQIAAAMRKAGFPEEEIPTGVAIVMAESGGKAIKSNVDPNSWGPWQINLDAHKDISRTQANSLQSATNYAKKLYDASGWGPWTAYTLGTYRQYLNGQSPQTGANIGNPRLGTMPGDESLPPMEGGGNQDFWSWIGKAFDFINPFDNQPAKAVPKTPEQDIPTLTQNQSTGDQGILNAILAAGGGAGGSVGNMLPVYQSWQQERRSRGENPNDITSFITHYQTVSNKTLSADDIKDFTDYLKATASPGVSSRNLTAAELRRQEIEADISAMDLDQKIYEKGRRTFKEFADYLAQEIAMGNLKQKEAENVWNRGLDREKLRLAAPQSAATMLKTLGGGAVPNTPQRLPGFSGLSTEPQPFQPFVDAFAPQLPEEAGIAGQAQQNLPYLQQLAQQAAAMNPQFSGR